MAALAAAAVPAVGADRQPSLNQALAAPAADLAQSYLWIRFVIEKVLPVVEKGIEVHLGEQRLEAADVGVQRRRYEARLSTYRQAIETRGYRNLAGVYRATSNEACGRVPSPWISMIQDQLVTRIEIRQVGFDAQLIVHARIEGQTVTLPNNAAVVESTIAIADAMDSNLFFQGRQQGRQILIGPAPALTGSNQTTPPVGRQPEDCVIRLDPLPSRQSVSAGLGEFRSPV